MQKNNNNNDYYWFETSMGVSSLERSLKSKRKATFDQRKRQDQLLLLKS